MNSSLTVGHRHLGYTCRMQCHFLILFWKLERTILHEHGMFGFNTHLGVELEWVVF